MSSRIPVGRVSFGEGLLLLLRDSLCKVIWLAHDIGHNDYLPLEEALGFHRWL